MNLRVDEVNSFEVASVWRLGSLIARLLGEVNIVTVLVVNTLTSSELADW